MIGRSVGESRATRPGTRGRTGAMRRGLVAIWLASLAGGASADAPYNANCTPLQGVLGHDYFDFLDPASKPRLDIVEQYHFTPEIENLQRGLTGYIPGELDFVLRALPNHYRALAAMSRWQSMNRTVPDSLAGRIYTVDCYFKRAFALHPDDATLHIIYGTHLFKAGKLEEADAHYALAEEHGTENAELYYNRGLLKLQLGDRAAAQAYADKAYALGYPLPGLRNKLERSARK
jgi:tetratricopeptide (TPR) repeat protein